jgi:hypothetical protein
LELFKNILIEMEAFSRLFESIYREMEALSRNLRLFKDNEAF